MLEMDRGKSDLPTITREYEKCFKSLDVFAV